MQAHRAAGEVSIPLSPTVTSSPLPAPASAQEGSGGDALLERLSDRERDIALLAAQGLSNPEIANRLSISRHTVKFHLRSIFAKLEADNRTDLARLLAAHVPLPP